MDRPTSKDLDCADEVLVWLFNVSDDSGLWDAVSRVRSELRDAALRIGVDYGGSRG